MTIVDTENKKKKRLRCPLFIVMSLSIMTAFITGIAGEIYLGKAINFIWEEPVFISFAKEVDITQAKKAINLAIYNMTGISLPGLGNVYTDGADERETWSAPTDTESSPEEALAEEAEKAILEAKRLEEAKKIAEEEKQLEEERLERIEARYLEEYGQEPFSIEEDGITRYVSWNDNPARSRYYKNLNIRPVSTAYDFKAVDEDYYKNSIFIGDSRMQGLHDYSGWSEVTFCYKVGLNVYKMMTDTVRTNEGKSTVPDMLSARQYENVYIMLGINELGMGVPSDFATAYQKNIEEVRKLQPDARIIIMGIMFESAEYSDANSVNNNDNINARNAAIARLANGEDIFFLDMNPAVSDGSGALLPGITFDGVHLLAKYYSLWTDFMYSHGY